MQTITINFEIVVGGVLVIGGMVLALLLWRATSVKERRRRSIHELGLEEARLRQQSLWWRNVIFTGLALICLPTSMMLFIYGFREIPKLGTDGEWPTVTGYVYQTWVEYKYSRSDSYYAIMGTVNYEIAGRPYAREHQVGRAEIRGQADELAPMLLGRQLKVWYDPTEHARIDFNPVTWAFPLFFIVAAAVILCIGLGALYMLTNPPGRQPKLASSPFV